MSCFPTFLRRRKGRNRHTNINGLSRRDLVRRISFISALTFGEGWSLFRDWTSDLAQSYCCYSNELDGHESVENMIAGPTPPLDGG